jgi:hypothetical protein
MFWDPTLLRKTVEWLLNHAYQVATVDTADWSDAADMHRDIARTLDFPDYYGRNLDALNDCLGDVACGAYAVRPNVTGLQSSKAMASSRPGQPTRHTSCWTSSRSALDTASRPWSPGRSVSHLVWAAFVSFMATQCASQPWRWTAATSGRLVGWNCLLRARDVASSRCLQQWPHWNACSRQNGPRGRPSRSGRSSPARKCARVLTPAMASNLPPAA